MLKLLKQAKAAVELLNPAEVVSRAGREVRIGLVAATDEAYARMEEALGVVSGANGHIHRASDSNAPAEVDLVLYDSALEAPADAHKLDPANPEVAAQQLLRDHDDLWLPLARQFPGLRRPMLDHTIHAVAQENALFAVATALPDVVPSLVELPWSVGEWGSDTLFITANQVRMAFLVAAACDKPVGYGHQKAELVSIGLGAFGWRALARELAGKIPFGGGLVAKGAIAYAGTYLVGKGLEALHHGLSLSKADREAVYQHGLEQGRSVMVQPRL